MTSKEEAISLKTKGNESLKQGKYDEAAEFYSKAIQIDGENEILYSNRSIARIHQKKYRDALNDAEKVINLKPNWFKGYSLKGNALFQLKRYKESEESYLKGLEYDNDNKTIKDALNSVKYQLNKPTLYQYLFDNQTNSKRTILYFIKLLIFIFFILVLITFGNNTFYYRMFHLLSLSNSCIFIYREYGQPKFTKEYVATVLTNHSSHFALYSFIFLFSHVKVVSLFTVICHELVPLSCYLHTIMEFLSDSLAQKLYNSSNSIVGQLVNNPNFVNLSYFDKINTVTQATHYLSSYWEGMLILYLIVDLFSPYRSLFLLIIYLYYIKLKMVVDPVMKQFMINMDQGIQQFLNKPYIPGFLGSAYLVIKSLVSRFF